jgi:hypothetical protein
MYMVLFALLSIFGAWAAWRRNPMYTARSTFRGVIAVLLMIAATIALIALAVNISMKQSQAAGMVIVFATVIVAAIGMIGGIMKLSTPRVAVLPSTVKMVNFHRKKVGVWAKRWLWSMLASGALALVLPGTNKGIAYALASILALLGIVMLFAGYYAARNQDRSLTALEYNPWVHWQYSTAQWELWIDAQVARERAVAPAFIPGRDWWKLALVSVAIGAGTFVFGSGWVFNTIYTVVISALLALIAVLSSRSARHSPDTLRAKLKRCAPEAYFGEEGLFCDGVLTPWISTDDWLLEATVDQAAPRNLLLRFEKINAGNPSIPTSPLNQRVLLPEFAETDLATLQKKLDAKCPAARVKIC